MRTRLCVGVKPRLCGVLQVLSRDIRSLHQRRDVAPVAVPQQSQQQQEAHQVQQQGSTGHTEATAAGSAKQRDGAHQDAAQQSQQQQAVGPEAVEAAGSQQAPQYTVTLDGVEVTYSITGSGHVTVVDAAVANHS